ncbi:MAG: DEAD/DEAH box helicase [Mycobacteriaceae bacterium]
MIRLTDEWTKSAAARAVPGSAWDADEKAWVLHAPTPRAAAVALKLFPGLEHQHPELIELRELLVRDAKPVDYATQLSLSIGAPNVRAAMTARGWSLDKANVTPVGATDEYQSIDLGYAAAVLRKHKGFYLGWARGLGKTLGTAALIDDLDCCSTLVVAPNTAKQATWASELDWALPGHEILVLPNDKIKRERCLSSLNQYVSAAVPFVLVVHYEALAVIAGKDKKGNVGDGWKRLGIHWDLVAADEGHRLANPKAKQSKAIKKIPRTYALLASGSVFQNNWEEMFSPLQFLFPAVYKSRWRDWNDRFLDYVENGYGKTCIGIKENMIEQMRDELGRLMVYREKENLAVPVPVHVDMSPEQARIYRQVAEECMAQLVDGTTVKAQLGVAMLTKLRQVATGLDLLSENVQDSAKLDATIETIRTHAANGDDFVVFVWYRATAYALEARLRDELGLESWVVTGDVPQKDRTTAIKAFQAGERRVFIGTIPTLGESVNLQRANHVIRVDRSFNPALNQQAVDRVDRQGQERPVTLTDIITRGTVDELHVLPVLANKEALKSAIFGASG